MRQSRTSRWHSPWPFRDNVRKLCKNAQRTQRPAPEASNAAKISRQYRWYPTCSPGSIEEMVVSSLAHLPEPVLEQLLGGMLLTHFRSGHAEQTDLHLLREHELSIGPGSPAKVDWVIYDRVRRRPVGVFDLIRTVSDFRTKREGLRQLREAASTQLLPHIRVGLVAPESLSFQVRTWAKQHDLEVVTYPA